MAEIEITDEQRAYLDDLRETLAAEHVDRYGHVRPIDALQYLIDLREGAVAGDDGRLAEDAAGDDAGGSGSDSPTDGAADDADADGSEGGEDDDESRLDAMMSLLDTYDDHWSESDADDARYEVELPDGSVERVRTRDDVRSLLFQHYR